MKKVLLRLLLFLALPSVAAQAQDAERFRQFAEVGVFDAELSTHEANATIRAGMLSGDPEVVDLTIRAIGDFSSRSSWDKISGSDFTQSDLPARSFSDIEGLKPFLVDYYHKHHAMSGYNQSSVALNLMDEIEESQEAQALQEKLDQARKQGDESTAQSMMIEISEYVAPLVMSQPSWTMIPQILCSYWPGDVDVLKFLWRIEGVDLSAHRTAGTLAMLNLGRFTTPDANAFRIDALRSAIHSPDENAFIDAKFAVEGLALDPAPETLPIIIEAGLRQPLVRGEVLLALNSFGDEDLVAHRDAIQSLVSSHRPVSPGDTEVAALRRLGSLFESLDSASRSE